MNICPKCLRPLEKFTPFRPGDLEVCQGCATALVVSEEFAMVPACPEDLLSVGETRFITVIQDQMRVLARLANRQRPCKPGAGHRLRSERALHLRGSQSATGP